MQSDIKGGHKESYAQRGNSCIMSSVVLLYLLITLISPTSCKSLHCTVLIIMTVKKSKYHHSSFYSKRQTSNKAITRSEVKVQVLFFFEDIDPAYPETKASTQGQGQTIVSIDSPCLSPSCLQTHRHTNP